MGKMHYFGWVEGKLIEFVEESVRDKKIETRN
jgi:hypothetical protein